MYSNIPNSNEEEITMAMKNKQKHIPLQNYDHDARGLTLKMVDTFLCINDLTLDDLLAA